MKPVINLKNQEKIKSVQLKTASYKETLEDAALIFL